MNQKSHILLIKRLPVHTFDEVITFYLSHELLLIQKQLLICWWTDAVQHFATAAATTAATTAAAAAAAAAFTAATNAATSIIMKHIDSVSVFLRNLIKVKKQIKIMNKI